MKCDRGLSALDYASGDLDDEMFLRFEWLWR
jgi:hypothetical protein